MDIIKKIKDYQKNKEKLSSEESLFLAIADEIVNDFSYRLNQKTYLLLPDDRQELIEMNYEYLLNRSKQMPFLLTLKMSEIINKFKEAAEQLGFTIINNINEYQNDGQLYDLLGSLSKDRGLIEEEYNNIPQVSVPITFTVDEYSLKPFLPAVFKNTTANRGEDKYLIENKEQLNKILTLFELPESKQLNLKNEFVVQEYVKSFEGINSSLRVYSTCSGDIILGLFLYSMDKTSKKRVKKYGIDVFNPCEYLSDPSSKYYLNSKNILSNMAGGGKVVPLNPETNKLTPDDEIMLTLHEIDLDTLALPQAVIESCKKIAEFWETKKGAVVGIDFIYNSENNNWYYLETNRNPSVDGYKIFMDLEGYSKKDIKALMQLDALTKIVENIMTKDKKTEISITK